MQATRSTGAPGQAAFTQEERLFLQHVCYSFAAFLPLLSAQPEQLSFDAPDHETLAFTIDSLSVFRSPKSQLYYSNVHTRCPLHSQSSLRFASFQSGTCTSDYTVLTLPSCDFHGVNRALASVCDKPVRTAIRTNRTNFSTVLMAKLVLGSLTLVGVLPLYDEDVRTGTRRDP